MLTGLRTDDAYAAEVGRADVIVLIIGANDLGPVLDSWVDDDCDRGLFDQLNGNLRRREVVVVQDVSTDVDLSLTSGSQCLHGSERQRRQTPQEVATASARDQSVVASARRVTASDDQSGNEWCSCWMTQTPLLRCSPKLIRRRRSGRSASSSGVPHQSNAYAYATSAPATT